MRGRWALVAAAVVGLAVGGLVWWGTKDMGEYTGLTIVSGWIDGGEDAEDHRGRSERQVRFEPGGRLQFGFQLYNAGDKSVRVTGVDSERGLYLFDTTEVLTAPMPVGSPVPVRQLSAFKPFRLRPGQSQWIGFRYGYVDCQASSQGISTTIAHRVIHYKVGPFGQKVLLALPTQVAVKDTPGYCGPGAAP